MVDFYCLDEPIPTHGRQITQTEVQRARKAGVRNLPGNGILRPFAPDINHLGTLYRYNAVERRLESTGVVMAQP